MACFVVYRPSGLAGRDPSVLLQSLLLVRRAASEHVEVERGQPRIADLRERDPKRPLPFDADDQALELEQARQGSSREAIH